MGMFDFVKICLFSEVNGVVTLNGKPVSGVEVVRTAEMGHDNVYIDRAGTDDQGHYHFDARFTHSVRKIAPVEPVIFQKMVLFYQGKAYLGWQMTKRDYEINTELGQPINLTCGLDDEPKWRRGGRARYLIQGICRAAAMYEEEPIPTESD